MARLTEAQREDIRNALILGESQYKVSSRFEVSSATVNKIFKTIQEDEFLVKEVKGEIAIKSALNNKSERLVKAFDNKVNEELRRQGLVFNAAEKIIQRVQEIANKNQVIDRISVGAGVQNFEPRELDATDLKNLADTVDKASITLGVNQRHSNQQINVNTQNNNNLNHAELNQEIVQNTLNKFEDEY